MVSFDGYSTNRLSRPILRLPSLYQIICFHFFVGSTWLQSLFITVAQWYNVVLIFYKPKPIWFMTSFVHLYSKLLWTNQNASFIHAPSIKKIQTVHWQVVSFAAVFGMSYNTHGCVAIFVFSAPTVLAIRARPALSRVFILILIIMRARPILMAGSQHHYCLWQTLTHTTHNFTVKLGKLWILQIFLECLLCCKRKPIKYMMVKLREVMSITFVVSGFFLRFYHTSA